MTNNYKELSRKKAKLPEIVVIQNDIEEADNWDEAYWIGKCVFDQASGEADKLIMNAYEKAFSLGLNIRVDRECFLTATQQIAKIYFQFRKYDEAINMLMVLDSNVEQLPDWVNLYYASAQIHTDNVLYWAEVPELLFKRIDSIDEKNADSVRRRKFLFLEFLNRISEIAKVKSVVDVDKNAILTKANQLGISEARECLSFKVAVGLLNEMPDLPEAPTTTVVPPSNVSVYEEMISELNQKLSELQSIIDRQNLELTKRKAQADDQENQIRKLQSEIEAKDLSSSKQAEDLKHAREQEYAIQAKYKALESQLSGSEAARKQLEEDASIIGELQADVEDLKVALSVARRNNENLNNEITRNNETIEQLRLELLQSQENAQTLQATIVSQQAQIDVAEAAVKTAEAAVKDAEERAATAILSKPASGIIPTAMNEPTSISTQPTLLDILTVDNFLPRKQKILIIGGSETKEVHLRGKLKGMGFDFSKDQLEFELEYDNVKDYASRIKPWSGKYAGIIVGPCPHKAKDIDGYSSFIEQIKSEEGYPHVEEARDKSGTLKISNASIGEAMMKMAVYLQSIA